jgi:hypothetical protein
VQEIAGKGAGRHLRRAYAANSFKRAKDMGGTADKNIGEL